MWRTASSYIFEESLKNHQELECDDQQLDVSQPDMEIKLGAEPEFVKRLGLIGAGLTILPADKTNPKFRVAHLSGFLNRPTFGPARVQC